MLFQKQEKINKLNEMKRMKRHKVKKEKQEPSSSFTKEQEEHDLAYYIHDRVELMHQVFSTLKYKELKAMAPECVRHISIDDLQELCTEEVRYNSFEFIKKFVLKVGHLRTMV